MVLSCAPPTVWISMVGAAKINTQDCVSSGSIAPFQLPIAAPQLLLQNSSHSEICVSSNTANDPESAEFAPKWRKWGEFSDELHGLDQTKRKKKLVAQTGNENAWKTQSTLKKQNKN